eukprot:260540-Pelagomonas_calceolata.AAC.1
MCAAFVALAGQVTSTLKSAGGGCGEGDRLSIQDCPMFWTCVAVWNPDQQGACQPPPSWGCHARSASVTSYVLGKAYH